MTVPVGIVRASKERQVLLTKMLINRNKSTYRQHKDTASPSKCKNSVPP